MRVFIGSSKEQSPLVEWLTSFIVENFSQLEPVPWTAPWASGKFTLENLEGYVRDTDASILFWTPDDLTIYHGEPRYEPRDNLLIEAGMFLAAHGRERTQLFIPSLRSEDPRGKVAVPADLWGITWNSYAWVEGKEIEMTGLPAKARTVCARLLKLGPRPRPSARLPELAGSKHVEKVCTYVGKWDVIKVQGIVELASDPNARIVDIMAAYHVGDISRPLDEFEFRAREDATLRACFANVWDTPLAQIYLRKYSNRKQPDIQHTLRNSIQSLLGTCSVEAEDGGKVVVTGVTEPPAADYELRLTSQRITMGYYRVDDVAFVVPLDMKKKKDPAPLAWVLEKSTAPKAFKHYLDEFTQTFKESQLIYRSRQRV